jgi:hypothetical protein
MKLLHNMFVEHNSMAWLAVLWLLTIPLYIGLQAWFGIAWKGGWRIVALIPLIGVALATILAGYGAATIPDGPPIDLNAVLLMPLVGLTVFAPIGFIYEVIAGVVRLSVRRPVAAAPKWRATADEDGHYCFAVAL